MALLSMDLRRIALSFTIRGTLCETYRANKLTLNSELRIVFEN